MLSSPFGEKIDSTCPLKEHPNPYFRREDYLVLNGSWDFCITKSASFPDDYMEKILVPFAVETSLSGIARSVKKNDFLHYRKQLKVKSSFCKGAILHFQAVDQICDVYLDKKKITHHEGGYLPFQVDVSNILKEDSILEVVVTDDTASSIYPRGKQSNRPGGIWYTPTSGIYGSVYLERVPEERIESIQIEPLFDEGSVRFKARVNQGKHPIQYTVSFLGSKVCDGSFYPNEECQVQIPYFKAWSPEDPNLYEVRFSYQKDKVTSSFAMRKFSTVHYHGNKVFGLNNKPYFLSGVLDQGYFPESGLTPPSLEAMAYDIKKTKSLGFNLLRKHIKIEPLNWYYLCDYYGMIVMQDMVNGGSQYNPLYIMLRPFINFGMDDALPLTWAKLGRKDQASRKQFLSDLTGTVDYLYNVSSIAIWTIFNEGWGQFQSVEALTLLQSHDTSRLIDVNSGWYDQWVGDFSSNHIYFKKIHLLPDSSRILSLSEFGGYSYRVKGHLYSKKNFGYKMFKDPAELSLGIKNLYEKEVLPALKQGLSLCVYTQLSDVEEETNGLFTYDRRVLKVNGDLLSLLNDKLKFEGESDD